MAENQRGKGSTLLPPAVCRVLGLMGGGQRVASSAGLAVYTACSPGRPCLALCPGPP